MPDYKQADKLGVVTIALGLEVRAHRRYHVMLLTWRKGDAKHMCATQYARNEYYEKLALRERVWSKFC